MARLSATTKQWLNAINLTPEQVEVYFREKTLEAAEVVRDIINDMIQNDLGKNGGALSRYEGGITQNGTETFDLAGEKITVPTYLVAVIPPEDHIARDENIFDILDSGVPERPRKSTGAYTLYDLSPEKGRLNVPTRNVQRRGEGGRFGVSQLSALDRYNSEGVKRPEPRPRTLFTPDPGRPFFFKGPLDAVPPRNLYARIEKLVKRELKKRGLPPEGVKFQNG